MREIKFRVWDKEIKDGIAYGITIGPSLGLNQDIKRLQERFVLMQFTGLKDKNGKEIYEGDILKDDNDDLFEAKFGKLPLDKSGDCVCTYLSFYAKGYGQLGSAPYHECNQIGNWMEIIGNIYENPELLKVKK